VISLWCGVLDVTHCVVSIGMVLNVGIISFFRVVLVLVFGTHVCKGVLVWPVLMFGRMCCLRVAIIGKENLIGGSL